ncbi:MAG: PAS domain S-box protein [Candidatus Omnitrophica bacterium]|nr:PAS domain S-box protein [Candidatus Omnitrophota bacterium]
MPFTGNMTNYKLARKIGLTAMGIILLSGILWTGLLVKQGIDNTKSKADGKAAIMAEHIGTELTVLENAAETMAGSPWIYPAVLRPSPESIAHANSVLDRYNAGMGGSVSYLMDVTGVVVASSNRDKEDSFVGGSYAFRPYFKEAIEGRHNRFFALGVTSGLRGFFTASPVKDPQTGKIAGVIAIKKDFDEIEGFLVRSGNSYFVSPEGVIFLSSDPRYVLKSLFPIPPEVQSKLLASRQFGDEPFKPVMRNAPSDGALVNFMGKLFIVSIITANTDGWIGLTLEPITDVLMLAALGMLGTLIMLLLVLSYLSYLRSAERTVKLVERSEERFRVLSNATSEGVVVHSEGEIIECNRRFAEMFGYNNDEIPRMNIMDFIPIDDREEAADYLKEGKDGTVLLKGLKKDGGVIDIDVSGRPTAAGGRPAGILTFRDVTSFREMQGALESVAQEWVTTFNSIPDLISIHDHRFRIMRANKAFADFFGMRIDEVIGKNCYELMHKGSGPMRLCPFTETMITKQKKTVEFFEPAYGVYLEATTVPLYDNNGEVTGVIHVAKDVTGRKKAELAINKAYSQISQIFQGIGDGMCVVGNENRFLQSNKALSALFGLEEYEIDGKRLDEVFSTDIVEIFREGISRILSGENRVEQNVTIERRDEVKIPCIMTITPFYDVQEKMVGVIVSFKDISGQKDRK